MSERRVVIVHGTQFVAPEGAIAYKFEDASEEARWIYDPAELAELEASFADFAYVGPAI
jgi:hypothetical protein